MADGACDFGETPHGRNWILTRLDPFATIELCDEDFAPGIIPLLAGNLGVDAMGLYENIKRYVDKQAKQAEKDLAAAQAAESAGQQAETGQGEADGQDRSGDDQDETDARQAKGEHDAQMTP